jgi:hypothetical protein
MLVNPMVVCFFALLKSVANSQHRIFDGFFLMIQGGNRMVFALEGTIGVVIIPKMFSDKSQVQEIVFLTLISREGKILLPLCRRVEIWEKYLIWL